MLDCNNNESQILKTIAELLFEQVTCLGKFCKGNEEYDIAFELYTSFTYNKIAFLKSLFIILEKKFNFNLSDSKIPYCYNTQNWTSKVGLSGYVSTTNFINPSQILDSFLGFWNYQLICKKKSKTSSTRLIRASLWLYHKENLETVIKYIFDMNKYGYILFEKVIFDTLFILINAYSKTTSDKNFIQLFLGKEIPKNQEEWIKIDLSIPNLDEMKSFRSYIDILTILSKNCHQEINNLKNSNSYDEWIINLWTLGKIIRPIMKLINTFSNKSDQKLIEDNHYFNKVSNEILLIQKHISDNNNINIYRIDLLDRGLVSPNQTKKTLSKTTNNELAEKWKSMSYILAGTFFEIVKPNFHYLTYRQLAFSKDELTNDPIVYKYFNEKILTNTKLYQISFDEFTNYLSNLNQTNLSSGINKSKIKMFYDFYLFLCDKQIKESFDKYYYLVDNRNFDNAITLLNSLLNYYPFFSHIYYELGISHDENKNSVQALSYLMKSIIMTPIKSIIWKSLGIVLSKLGYQRESFLAISVQKMLEERERNFNHLVIEYDILLNKYGVTKDDFNSQNDSQVYDKMWNEMIKSTSSTPQFFSKKEFVNYLKEANETKIIQNLAREIESDIKKSGKEIPLPVYTDLFPTGSFNAQATRCKGGVLILLNRGTMMCIHMIIKILCKSSVFFENFTNDGTPIDTIDDSNVSNDDLVTALSEILLFYLGYLKVPYPRRLPLDSQAKIVVIANGILRSAEKFALSHEYGHLIAGHLNISQSQMILSKSTVGNIKVIPKSWEQEVEADVIALMIMLAQIPKKIDNYFDLFRVQQIFAGPIIYFGIDSLIVNIHAKIKKLGELPFSKTHPPSIYRLNYIRDYLLQIGGEKSILLADSYWQILLNLNDEVIKKIDTILN